jgi:hypothetical protein
MGIIKCIESCKDKKLSWHSRAKYELLARENVIEETNMKNNSS